LPKDVTEFQDFSAPLDAERDLPGYTFPSSGDESKIKEMAKYLQLASKPLLLIGHGAMISGAHDEVRKLVEKLQAPVVNTLLAKGVFPETHDLSMGMLGMHGTAYANKAVHGCDLIFSIGSRWDDRITPKNIERFCPDAVKLHIDIDPAEINKILTPDVSVVGDAKTVLNQLLPHIKPGNTKDWVETVKKNKKKFPLKFKKQGGLKAQHVIQELFKISKGNAVVTTDVGQHQMWAAQFYLTDKPKHWLSSGGAGTMGYGLPSAIGAQFGCPKAQVITICGDGGFQMTLCELATAAIHKLPIKIVILDNKYLGMVRQWQGLFYDNRLSGVDLVGNPDFVKLAKSYGIKGFRIKRAADVHKILTQALNYNDGPCLIHAEVVKEDNVFPMIPAGGAAGDMILGVTKDMKKPEGST
ncbi:acetolactate synthase large subunit, partial [bacterium]|nr:acetolactate synthase large subunit [bacterium]